MKNFTQLITRQTIVCLMLLLLGSVTVAKAQAPDSKGRDYWLTFPGNVDNNVELTLFISGEAATSGQVTIPGLSFSQNFTVTPGSVTSVTLPANAQLTSSNMIQNRGIRVTAQAEVTVYGLNRREFSTDAFLALPTDILGTEYINLGYRNTNVVNATQLAIVGTVNGTTVTITPSVTTDGRTAGVPYTITLDQGQTYLLRNTGSSPNDLSGTVIMSSSPVGVYGSHGCANIPSGALYCDYIVEQLPPTSAWGRQFVTMPLATRERGDTFRFLASVNGTQVQVNGATVATLNRGQFHEQIVTGPARITASQPILVAQYANGGSFDNTVADPFMMLIPPYEQFLGSYTVSTPPSGFRINYINVVAPTAAIGSIRLDGTIIPASRFMAIPGSSFSGAQMSVSLGTHNLTGGGFPFGAFVYGFNDDDSYGYPGGQSLSQIATVNTITLSLTPGTTVPVGTERCLQATARDVNNNPVEGVRVDFAITGANAQTGFATTNASGIASFCYTGMMAGTDNITASSGVISAMGTLEWISTTPTCNIMLSATTTPVTTRGGSNGTINLTVSGGTAPYTYMWSNGRTTEDLTGLMAGSYTGTVTDARGCTATATVTVMEQVVTPGTCANTGSLSWELWNLAPNITEVYNFPVNTEPASTGYINSFATPANIGDNYGLRVRGYICAPVSGEYTFYLSGDDRAELYLSSDMDPMNKQRIAFIRTATRPEEYNKYPSQMSAKIMLQAGQRYYIESRLREFRFADHMTVAWQLPNGTMESPIAGNHLIPFVPMEVTGILWEYLLNLPADFRLPSNGEMPQGITPSGSRILESFESPTNFGNQYGARARGYVIPPASGMYTFRLAADDEAELWLSTDNTVANRQLIAEVRNWTRSREYNKYPSQTSREVYLEAGQRYYIETLHVEYWGRDNLSVGWSMAGGMSEAVISGRYLRPYVEEEEETKGLVWNYLLNPPADFTLPSNGAMVEGITPSGSRMLNSFESPTNFADKYGAQIRGYVVPPASGMYTFMLAADDQAELWLSTDNTVGNRQLIAEVMSWTRAREYNKFPSQTSMQVYLEAGRRYYIETLHLETYGRDNLSVGWSMAGGMSEAVISGEYLRPFEGDMMLLENNQGATGTELTAFDEEVKTLNAYPNPFSDKITLEFFMEEKGEVRLDIFNLKGELVKTVVNGMAEADRVYKHEFDGSQYASGVYICRLSSNGKVEHKRIVLAK